MASNVNINNGTPAAANQAALDEAQGLIMKLDGPALAACLRQDSPGDSVQALCIKVLQGVRDNKVLIADLQLAAAIAGRGQSD
jgi:hypothetical protein